MSVTQHCSLNPERPELLKMSWHPNSKQNMQSDTDCEIEFTKHPNDYKFSSYLNSLTLSFEKDHNKCPNIMLATRQRHKLATAKRGTYIQLGDAYLGQNKCVLMRFCSFSFTAQLPHITRLLIANPQSS